MISKFKKAILPLLAVFILTFCFVFSACANPELVETHRTEKSAVGEWHKFSIFSIKQYGIPINYEFKNAEIETGIISEEGGLVVVHEDDVINGWESLPDYIDDEDVKLAPRECCPLKTYYISSFQWAPAKGWEGISERGSKVVEDYVTFIARKENHIVGFAVFYVYSDGFEGGGEVFSDKEFPKVNGKYQNVSERTVKKRIQEVIEVHKNYLDKIGK